MSNLSNATVAVIGEATIAKIFRALGFDCFYDTERDALLARCDQLTADGYRIILILEHEAAKIDDYLDAHAADVYPIILPIPDTLAGSQYGMTRLRANLAKAIGRQVEGENI